MQSHFLAGGNVENVTLAMIAAQRAQIPLEWQRAAAIDLAGRNVLEALQTSVNPKVIETPIFQGVAQNGIQLNVKARITVRSNLDRYVGGAGEPTIVARVGEGVVSAVGAADRSQGSLEYPDRISKAVLAKGLDAGTAFEIVSIDIADVDVGKNIGAELQTSQAEADRRIAQAKAAERQYAAQAAEQEQKAETQAMRAKVVEAEAAIPQAIAQAFRSGNLGVMDYYRLKNIQADTEMRSSIGASTESSTATRSRRSPAPPSRSKRACATSAFSIWVVLLFVGVVGSIDRSERSLAEQAQRARPARSAAAQKPCESPPLGAQAAPAPRAGAGAASAGEARVRAQPAPPQAPPIARRSSVEHPRRRARARRAAALFGDRGTASCGR